MRPRRVPLLLLVALAALAAPPAPLGQARGQSALDSSAAPLFQELAALKGMAAPGPPPPVLLKTREETRAFIEEELARRYSARRVEAERQGLVAWGLIPKDYDLRRLFVDLMQEQLAAYYDPRRKVMVLADWLPADQQQLALLHELVHALQDRQISLDAFIAPMPGRGDQLLARQALIEGEAVAMSFELLLQAQGTDLASLPDLGTLRAMIATTVAGQALGTAPKFLRDLLTFPYVEGLAFMHQFRKRRPWSSVSSLYQDPPRSTAQILHPEKRLGLREDPIPVEIPDVSPLIPAAGVVAEDELGEFALGAVLGLHLGEPAGRRAAAGWRGDRYRVWQDEAGRLVLAYLLAMDGERAANAVALAYTTVLERRHPRVARKGIPRGTGTIVTWQDAGHAFVVEKRGAEVLVLEQVPLATAERIREAVWRSRAGSGGSRP
jgi:hypothetical protein